MKMEAERYSSNYQLGERSRYQDKYAADHGPEDYLPTRM